ncbi:unnamed protein product [Coccothraustes coccothraustes]
MLSRVLALRRCGMRICDVAAHRFTAVWRALPPKGRENVWKLLETSGKTWKTPREQLGKGSTPSVLADGRRSWPPTASPRVGEGLDDRWTAGGQEAMMTTGR